MGLAEESGHGGYKLAKRFLQTAVVVDDEAYMAEDSSDGPKGEVVVPDRRTLASRVLASGHEDQSPVGPGSGHTLDARSVINSFAKLGVICGVVDPTQSAMEMMRKADIVVLDWRLQKHDSTCALALELLGNLLDEESDQNSLRLVAIYTGEAQLEDIRAKIIAKLTEAELEPIENGNKAEILYRHGRVVFYAKSDVNLAEPLKERSVAEEDLPKRLVKDFADMTEGLLPSIALTSLTAVREGAHKVLDQFCAELDPAFLTHRACISNPDDAELQIVSHVAEELRGLMDNAVAEQSPAGAEAVENWIRNRNPQGGLFMFGQEEFDLDQTIALVQKGLEESSGLGKNAFEGLSAGFAGSDIVDLDARLARIMSFRTVFNAPAPMLWLGSVVTEMVDGEDAKHLICMRPRCDCVRREKEAWFFFLPLVKPKKGQEQLVVRLGDKFERQGIGFHPDGWVHRQFKPKEGPTVTAEREEPNSPFVFTDTCNRQYTWQGELTAEYAQRIAQAFATNLSRVAVNESEWLRRMARKD